jgi:hypothetical protein
VLLAADGSTAGGGPPDAPARKLPAVTTVCRAPATRRCWTEPGEGHCADGEVFRIVIAGADVETALASCRDVTPSDRRTGATSAGASPRSAGGGD